MKILVTGGGGYLGSVFCRLAWSAGFDVVNLDTGFYRDGWMRLASWSEPPLHDQDVRRVEESTLRGYDAVVHMGELSNDPVCNLDPVVTAEINHHASVRLAGLARRAGVKRFVYMSSASIYGAAADQVVDESTPIQPLTPYGHCKASSERDISALATDDFSPTFLRNSTAYGASPRMRFDIVLNNLCGLAHTTREIRMTSDGSPWRPLVHAEDIARAICEVLRAPREAIHNEIFNVGDDEQNYRVREIAETVAAVFPGCGLQFGPPGTDKLSYRASFAKIHRHLPGFKCRWNLRRGAEQLRDFYQRIQLTPEMFRARAHTRARQIEYLRTTGQIDEHYFWVDQ
ncbi:NAD-dependent epimerase/dehydratase family protein [bacterium]|nr:NAD-dependent epimerase/dehydratase family protein [bacterium]